MNRKMRSKFNNLQAKKRKDHRARYSDATRSIPLEVGQTVSIEGCDYTIAHSDGRPARGKLN